MLLPMWNVLYFYISTQAYNNVNRDMLWKIMEEKIPSSLLKIIKHIYRNTKVSIKFNDDATSELIQINKGV
jgi:hypothetical protein